MCELVAMARRSGRAPTAQSWRTNGRLTGHIHRLQKVLQKSRARISDSRTVGGRRRGPALAAQRTEAARAARAAPARCEPGRLDRPDRGRPVGRAAATDRSNLIAELRLTATQAARLRGARDEAAGLPIADRARAARSGAVRAPRRGGASSGARRPCCKAQTRA